MDRAMLNSRLISMLIGLGILSACSEGDDRGRDAQNDNGADLSMRIDGGNEGAGKISVAIPGIGRKLKLPALSLGKTDVDIDGVKLYPGAKVTGVDVAGQEGASEGGVVIKFDSPAAPQAIQSYYLDALRKKGLTASAEGTGVSGHDHDGKSFRIDLDAQGSGTRGVIHIG